MDGCIDSKIDCGTIRMRIIIKFLLLVQRIMYTWTDNSNTIYNRHDIGLIINSTRHWTIPKTMSDQP